jgi:hypothetical protein
MAHLLTSPYNVNNQDYNAPLGHFRWGRNAHQFLIRKLLGKRTIKKVRTWQI